MSEFSIVPEAVRAAAAVMFAASEQIHDAMSTVADEADELAGGAEAGAFTGIAELVEATRTWDQDYIAVHRADIEDLAKSAAVHAAETEAVDGYVSSMFDDCAEDYFPDGRSAPEPERPGPDPADQLPAGSESVAV